MNSHLDRLLLAFATVVAMASAVDGWPYFVTCALLGLWVSNAPGRARND